MVRNGPLAYVDTMRPGFTYASRKLHCTPLTNAAVCDSHVIFGCNNFADNWLDTMGYSVSLGIFSAQLPPARPPAVSLLYSVALNLSVCHW